MASSARRRWQVPFQRTDRDHDLGSRADLERPQDRADMGFHSRLGEIERAADRLVALALSSRARICRPADPAGHQIGIHHQPQDRQGTQPRHSARRARHRGRGERIAIAQHELIAEGHQLEDCIMKLSLSLSVCALMLGGCFVSPGTYHQDKDNADRVADF
jgi:hypothetical protein